MGPGLLLPQYNPSPRVEWKPNQTNYPTTELNSTPTSFQNPYSEGLIVHIGCHLQMGKLQWHQVMASIRLYSHICRNVLIRLCSSPLSWEAGIGCVRAAEWTWVLCTRICFTRWSFNKVIGWKTMMKWLIGRNNYRCSAEIHGQDWNQCSCSWRI